MLRMTSNKRQHLCLAFSVTLLLCTLPLSRVGTLLPWIHSEVSGRDEDGIAVCFSLGKKSEEMHAVCLGLIARGYF